MTQLSKLIESEIADFFEGFGHPGEPEIQNGEAQRLLSDRIIRLLAAEAQEPVAEVKSWWPLGVDGGEQRMFNPIGNVPPIGTKLYAAPPVAQAVQVPGWTNEQCLEFLSIAFRHAEIKGDLELDDIRLGVKMANAMLPALQPESE